MRGDERDPLAAFSIARRASPSFFVQDSPWPPMENVRVRRWTGSHVVPVANFCDRMLYRDDREDGLESRCGARPEASPWSATAGGRGSRRATLRSLGAEGPRAFDRGLSGGSGVLSGLTGRRRGGRAACSDAASCARHVGRLDGGYPRIAGVPSGGTRISGALGKRPKRTHKRLECVGRVPRRRMRSENAERDHLVHVRQPAGRLR